MRILAIESSAKAASSAISVDGNLTALYFQKTGLTHSRTLLPMIDAMLKNCELKIQDMDLIAVARGPGSFTGIRIGCATAKGLMWAAEKPGCGVSTLEAMARQAENMQGNCSGHIICPVMDARRSQVYNALFEVEGDSVKRLCPDRAISIMDLGNELKNAEKPVFILGDGAELCYNTLCDYHGEKSGLQLILAPEGGRYQNAWGVALAAMVSDRQEHCGTDPVYLRPSQAERERAQREKDNSSK